MSSKDQISNNVNDAFEQKLAGLKLGNALKLADDYIDMDVECISTGFPSLDRSLHPILLGLPRGRHTELYGRNAEVGKTSVAVAIAKTWQDMGYSVGIVDIEKTLTKSYYDMHGLILDNSVADKYALRVMRHEIQGDPMDNESINIYLEEILNTIKVASQIFDLLIVDSVDALVSENDAAKGADENKQTGGISKKLSEFFRQSTNNKAHIIWINQMRMGIGGYNPSGNIKYNTTGGKALEFYSSIRLELAMIEKLRENDQADPYGFTTRITCVKNKIAAPWRTADLTYIFGEGFSKTYDVFNEAINKNIIIKKGAWFDIPILGKLQGKLNVYNQLKNNPEAYENVRKLLQEGIKI